MGVWGVCVCASVRQRARVRVPAGVSLLRSPVPPTRPPAASQRYVCCAEAAGFLRADTLNATPLPAPSRHPAASVEFMRGLRKLCDEAGALLVFDEVQVGGPRVILPLMKADDEVPLPLLLLCYCADFRCTPVVSTPFGLL